MAYNTKSDNVTILKNQLKSGEIKSVYSFFGEEEFLKQFYYKELVKKITGDENAEFSVTQFDEYTFELDAFIDETANLSFSAENKLIVLRDIDIDAWLSPADKKALTETLLNLGEGIYVVLMYDAMFLNSCDFDKQKKRKKMISSQNKFSFVVEFKTQYDSALIPWITRLFQISGVKIGREDAEYMLKVCGSDMTNLKNEITKLSLSAKSGAVDKTLIDSVASRSTELNVFNIAKDAIKGNAKTALKTLSDCKIAKQEPIVILRNIETTFFELVLTRAALDKGVMSATQIVADFGIATNRAWLFKDYMVICKTKDIQTLIRIMNESVKTEKLIKGSGNDQWQSIELLIMKILSIVRKEN